MAESIVNIENEEEITVYAEIGDWEGLKEAVSFEDQIQYESKLEGGGFQRLRITAPSGDLDRVSAEYTVKRRLSNNPEVRECKEFNKTVDISFKEVFRYACSHFLCKTRAIFNISKLVIKQTTGENTESETLPEVKFEVDTYTNKEGKRLPIVKIDIEIQDLKKFISDNYPDIGKYKLSVDVSKLPFKPFNILNPDTSAEDKAKVNAFWDEARIPITSDGGS